MNGWKGITHEKFVLLEQDQIKLIHHRGGTYLGTARSGFDKERIIDSLMKNGFNQLYVICGGSSYSPFLYSSFPSNHFSLTFSLSESIDNVLELYYEIRKRKLSIAICCVPRSIDNSIPIIDESFGYQTAIEVIYFLTSSLLSPSTMRSIHPIPSLNHHKEASRIIESARVESHSHRNGISIVRVMG